MRFRFAVLAALALSAAGCGRKEAIDRVEWPVMDTVAAVQTRGVCDAETAAAVRGAFAEVNGEFNRFDENSCIRRHGRCSALGQPCWDFAFRLRDETGGRFDPRWRGADTLDFGAVAKGFAVDLAASRLKRAALVDLGGNLKAVGGDWRVGVLGGESFTLRSGAACATSAKYFRGEHIQDARTGLAVSNRLHSVTVVHPSSAMIADGLSTVMFLLGRERGEAFLKTHYPEATAIWTVR